MDPVNYAGSPASSEGRLEQVAAKNPLAIPPGRFYRVRAINKNGSFYQNEPVPLDPNDIATTGRTIHLCAAPRCNSAPIDASAACELLDMPACGPLGVVWNQPPRSLEACRAINPLFSPCEETPYQFAGGSGIIYVDDPNQPRYVQTRLSGIHCHNETGRTNRPNVNPDEVIVAFASVVTDLPGLPDLQEEGGFGVVKVDLNAGDKRRSDWVLGSVPLTSITARQESVVMVGEDDWMSAKQWAIAHAAGIVASGLGLFGGWKAAVSAGGAAELGTLIGLVLKDAPDPDDQIGRAVWTQNIAELQQRGLLAHDSEIADEVPLLTRVPTLQKHIVGEEAGRHPGVDLVAYSSNDDLVSCSDDSACGTGRICRLGACVPPDWSDRTLPRDYDPQVDAAGTIERIEMDGSRSNYRVYISTSLSVRDARE